MKIDDIKFATSVTICGHEVTYIGGEKAKGTKVTWNEERGFFVLEKNGQEVWVYPTNVQWVKPSKGESIETLTGSGARGAQRIKNKAE